MRKALILCLVSMLFLLYGCVEDSSVLNKIKGRWYFNYEQTWKYKNPGEVYTDKDDLASAMIGEWAIEINPDEQTLKTLRFGEQTDINRYRIIEETKANATLGIDGRFEYIELLSSNRLVLCPQTSNTNKCLVYTREKKW